MHVFIFIVFISIAFYNAVGIIGLLINITLLSVSPLCTLFCESIAGISVRLVQFSFRVLFPSLRHKSRNYFCITLKPQRFPKLGKLYFLLSTFPLFSYCNHVSLSPLSQTTILSHLLQSLPLSLLLSFTSLFLRFLSRIFARDRLISHGKLTGVSETRSERECGKHDLSIYIYKL